MIEWIIKGITGIITSPRFREAFLKYSANIVFLAINCFLVANLLTQLSDKQNVKDIYLALTIGLEVLVQYIIALAKAYWRLGGWQNGNRVKSVGLWFIYTFYMSLVIAASIGFALSEVDAKSKTAEIYNDERTSIVMQIKSDESERDTLTENMKQFNPNGWRIEDAQQRKDKLNESITEGYDKLKNFKEVRTDLQKDIYDVLGKVINKSGDFVKLYMLFIIGLMIQIALLLTSWDIVIGKDKDKAQEEKPKEIMETVKNFIIRNRDNLIKFIDALVDENYNRLNGNEKVMKVTGFSFNDCQRFKKILSEHILNDGMPLIYTTQGTSKANFSRDKMKDVILKIA